MTIREIVAFVTARFCKTVTPMTVRNWQRRGRGGQKLAEQPGESDLLAFIQRTNALKGRGRPSAVDFLQSATQVVETGA